MAEYTVQHSCGHEVKHRYDGPEAERQRRQKWLRSKPCQVCWQSNQAGEAAAQGKDLNLPELEGVDEDIRWAEVVRAKAITHNRDFYSRVTRKPDNTDENKLHQAIVRAADSALQELEEQSQALWWIENRFEVIDHLRRATIAAVEPLMDNGNS